MSTVSRTEAIFLGGLSFFVDVIDDVIIDTACVGTSVYMYNIICLNEVRMYIRTYIRHVQ